MAVQRSNSKFGDGRVGGEVHEDCQNRIARMVIGSAEEAAVVCAEARAEFEQAYRAHGMMPVFSSTKEIWTLAWMHMASWKRRRRRNYGKVQSSAHEQSRGSPAGEGRPAMPDRPAVSSHDMPRCEGLLPRERARGIHRRRSKAHSFSSFGNNSFLACLNNLPVAD